ncbi:MAG: glutamine-hydrolyzing carbamoyl-phosphate synthase small subunit [Nitrososphaerota archaeon]|nr:glutamine-hydrolyzing carbamoyl-phosphate synthase small subunit [Candidatus Calditenuaceae archaeon]MDW8073000.1 glutamine-hydrolyzing carbamoyl-phosphate synthase small subunit [Nitrososphaerota archaeon]
MEGLVGGYAAALALEDGSFIIGRGFGGLGKRSGEVVFSTAMNGYTESLTDPSYVGQILILTYPLIGNYGVPPDFESDGIKIEALVVSLATEPSHPLSEKSLSEWLRENGVPGVMDVDTRMLVKRIREEGVMGGAVQVAESFEDISREELLKMAREVDYDSRIFEYSAYKEPVVFNEDGGPLVAVVDFGVKYGVIDRLVKSGFRVVVVPGRLGSDAVFSYGPRGVVISNGPGNPAKMSWAVKIVREIVESGVPTLGVCLGHQLLALALGAETYKLKYGHRGINKACRDLVTGRRVITLQNHGYAVSEESLERTGFKVWFQDCDDGTVEGLIHESYPCISVQFHPEGRPGPRDALYVFEMFEKMVRSGGNSP